MYTDFQYIQYSILIKIVFVWKPLPSPIDSKPLYFSFAASFASLCAMTLGQNPVNIIATFCFYASLVYLESQISLDLVNVPHSVIENNGYHHTVPDFTCYVGVIYYGQIVHKDFQSILFRYIFCTLPHLYVQA